MQYVAKISRVEMMIKSWITVLSKLDFLTKNYR
jgi:hypothetical protein